jgi:class 3 adenylate cyclase
MRRILLTFNNRRKDAGMFILENGVGIASGPAISGNLGVAGIHMDFSITGKVLRLANDLEALSKLADISRIVIDETSARRVNDYYYLKPLEVEDISCLQLIGERNSEA